MIEVFNQKRGSIPVVRGLIGLKNEIHPEKTKFTYDLRRFMTFLSKVLENDFALRNDKISE